MPTPPVACRNYNHGRLDAPVRFCPSCGGIVNVKVSLIRCAVVRHDTRRRGGAAFCVDCGERLAMRAV